MLDHVVSHGPNYIFQFLSCPTFQPDALAFFRDETSDEISFASVHTCFCIVLGWFSKNLFVAYIHVSWIASHLFQFFSVSGKNWPARSKKHKIELEWPKMHNYKLNCLVETSFVLLFGALIHKSKHYIYTFREPFSFLALVPLLLRHFCSGIFILVFIRQPEWV